MKKINNLAKKQNTIQLIKDKNDPNNKKYNFKIHGKEFKSGISALKHLGHVISNNKMAIVKI